MGISGVWRGDENGVVVRKFCGFLCLFFVSLARGYIEFVGEAFGRSLKEVEEVLVKGDFCLAHT